MVQCTSQRTVLLTGARMTSEVLDKWKRDNDHRLWELTKHFYAEEVNEFYKLLEEVFALGIHTEQDERADDF